MEGKAERLKLLIEKLKHIKHIEIIAALLVASVALLIVFRTEPTETSQTTGESGSAETELEDVLSLIKGAGRVKVYVLYENDGEIIPAYDVQSQKSKVSETAKDGTVKYSETENITQKVVISQSEPLILERQSAKVGGVIIVAQGAEDVTVRMKLIDAARIALNVETSKIEVYDMK